MHFLAPGALLLLVGSVSLAQEIRPAERVTTELLDVQAPAAPGWQLTQKSAARITFARAGEHKNDTLGAFAIVFRIPAPRDREHFLELIREGSQADTPPDRFRAIKSEFQQDDARPYPCVRYAAVHEDRQAKLRTGGVGPLILQSITLYCMHPDTPGVAFALGYSHRGQESYPALEAEAADFIAAGTVRSR
jgi:hypothetical protein